MSRFKNVNGERIPFTPEEEAARDAEEIIANMVIPPSTDPVDYPLTPAQFTWLNAKSGLDDATEAVLAHAKATDRELFADLKMALGRSSFRFDVTMGLVRQMIALGVLPDTAAVSEAAIGDLWLLAKDK